MGSTAMCRQAPRLALLLLVMGLVVVTGCSRSPEAKKARHLERGDRYFAKEQYRDAVIEYQRALRIDPNERRAITRAGLSLVQLGSPGRAYPYLVKAIELDPGNAEARLKPGPVFVQAG